MLQMFYKHNNANPSTVEFLKIATQHTLVFIVMSLMIYFWQQETFWGLRNFKQSICFYSILIVFCFTIPVFTLGEHVSSNVRQCFLMSVTAICYIQIFPPPLIHGLISSYLVITHFLYRTHAFNLLSSLE